MDMRDETRLAHQVIDAAAKALATLDRAPLTERVLKEYREDAKVVAAAVVVRLARSRQATGLFPRGGLEVGTLETLAQELGQI